MPVDRIKELVQEGLRRKLSGDLQGAADVWAEALRMDPTNRRAAEGLGELKLAGIVPAPPSGTATPALGIPVPQPALAAKDPFAKPPAPYFEPTPSPFVPEGANPLSLPVPAKAKDPQPFGSSPTAVFGGGLKAPGLTPSPFESSPTMAFGGTPPLVPPASSPSPPPLASSHTMAFGMPSAAVPGATPPETTLPPATTLEFGGLKPSAASPPQQPPPQAPAGPVRPPGLPLTFKRTGFPFDLESPTIDETAKAASAHKPTPLPGTPLPFVKEPFEGAGPSALSIPDPKQEEGASPTLVFGGTARPTPPAAGTPEPFASSHTMAFGMPGLATVAPAGPGPLPGGEQEPLVASSPTLGFGAAPPSPATPAEAGFPSSGTMVMGLKVDAPDQLAPAVMLERGKMPLAFTEPDAPKTSPFGQAADQALQPAERPKTSPFGNASLAKDALRGPEQGEAPHAPVMDPVGAAFDFQSATAAPDLEPSLAPEPPGPEAPGQWSFTPLSMVRPAVSSPLPEPSKPTSLPSFTPLSMVRPTTPVPAPVPGVGKPEAAFTPLSMVKPVEQPQGAPSLTPTKLVAPPAKSEHLPPPALPRPVSPPAAPSSSSEESDVDLDIDVDEGAQAAAAAPAKPVAPSAPAVPPAPEPAPAEAPPDIGTLLLQATDLLDLDDYSGAMAAVDKVLERDASNATAQELRSRCEATLLAMTESKLGDLTRRPKTMLTPDQIVWLNIDHRAGFLLSLIDGTVSFEELFLLSSMPRLETAKILLKLLQEKAIS